MNKDKKIYLEIIKITALILVIFNHTSGYWVFTTTSGKITYLISIFMSHLCKIAVPLFFMCSGALLLGKEESIGNVLKKRVFRYAVVLLLFSFANYLRRPFDEQGILHYLLYFGKTVYTEQVVRPYWFLYSYLAVLIMLPILRTIVRGAKKELYIYLAALQFLFVGVLPVIGHVTGGKYYCNMDIVLVSANIFFFIMGYYFEHVISEAYEKAGKYAYMGILFSVFILILCCILQYWNYRITGSYTQVFYDELIAIPAFATFFWLKYIFIRCNVSQKCRTLILFLGSNTFGVYLLEDWIREKTAFIYDHLYFKIFELPAALVWIVAVIIIGNIITFILKKLPIIRRLI